MWQRDLQFCRKPADRPPEWPPRPPACCGSGRCQTQPRATLGVQCCLRVFICMSSNWFCPSSVPLWVISQRGPLSPQVTSLILLFRKDGMETWGASSSPAFYCLGCKNESGSLEPMHVVSQKLDSARTGFQQTRGWDVPQGSRPVAFLLQSWEPGLDRARPPPQQIPHVRRSRDNSSCFWEGRDSVLTGSSADAVPLTVLTTTLMENKWRRCPDSGRLTSAAPRTAPSRVCLSAARCRSWSGPWQAPRGPAVLAGSLPAPGSCRGPGSAPGTGSTGRVWWTLGAGPGGSRGTFSCE